ncbi:MAG TPA: choice-of-anchor M domain-containing protein, partial [Verrucomicrobiae bacterium]|nr:choice-of-anchor M domain-containing protein [Verrucomicrobiae bacterium]
MNLKLKLFPWVIPALLVSAQPSAQAQPAVLSSGHTDLALEYADGGWNLHVGSDATGEEFAASNVVLRVKAAARAPVPADPKFNFLGAAGTTVWLLPQTQNEDLLYLGYGGDDLPDGVFAGNQVRVTLKSVDGPGDFFSYKTDTFGNPVVYFNTRDGITTNDTITVQAGGDAHLNWAFTAAGTYTVVLEASGTLVAGNTPTSSGPVAYTFSVTAPTVWAAGHTDIALEYAATNNTWDLHLGQDATGVELAASEVLLKARAGAKTTVPADAKFGFLGAAGSPVWILPQTQNENLLYLGYGGDDIPDGVFVGNQVRVTLKSVTGPGDFFSYKTDTFGNPVVYFNTRDGVSTNDTITVQAGGDAHLNWAFTAPGVYTMVIEASGTLAAGNQATSSGPVAYTFTVVPETTVLSSGHTDLALDYDAVADAWDLHVGSDTLEEEFAADDVTLQVKPEAKTTVPADPKFGFLGNAGDAIWLLPQTQNEEILYLGYGGDGIPDGVFAGNQVKVTFKSVDGPGDFFSYKTDTFGNPVVYFNTRDGITTNDTVTVQAGGDAHLNWAFTKAGTYTVVLEASGTLANSGATTSSGPVIYTFDVQPVVVDLTNEHVDLRIEYDASGTNHLSIVAGDEDHHIHYATNEVYLVVKESGKLSLPAGTPFGNGGDPLWVIPQSQNPNLLYLGISAEDVPLGVFNGNLGFELTAIDGPGSFFLWQADSTGNLNVRMNTADGISDFDETTPIIPSHEHYNWGFTTNGVYHLTFQASGRRLGEATNVTSLPATFTFHV